jgi:hypothetical protein
VTRYFLTMSVGFFLSVSTARAEEPKPIKLLLTPAKPPTPALRYQLLPDARIIVSGDAAPLYRQAAELVVKKRPYYRAVQEWLDAWDRLPVNKLPIDAMRKVLAEYDDVYALLDQAARCDRCDWHWLAQAREQNMDVSNGELQVMREAAQVLVWRTRLEMAEGRLDKALVTLRNGLALARHVGESDMLIGYLVGLALAHIMEWQLDQLLQQPGAPNLYYALTDLPAPFINIRQALKGERVLVYYRLFPGCSDIALDLNGGSMTASQLEASVKIVRENLKSKRLNDLFQVSLKLGGNAALAELIQPAQPALSYLDLVHLTRTIHDKHESSMMALVAAGRPLDKVDAMPHVQVALLHALLEYDATFDELTVWQQLPYWELSPRLGALKKRYYDQRQSASNVPAIPLAGLYLFPGIDRYVFAGARVHRKVELLRTIEAIRFYAATHDNRLPPSLAAVKDVPIPLDPVTGQAFEYELADSTAILRAPAPGQEKPAIFNSFKYELRIRK